MNIIDMKIQICFDASPLSSKQAGKFKLSYLYGEANAAVDS